MYSDPFIFIGCTGYLIKGRAFLAAQDSWA